MVAIHRSPTVELFHQRDHRSAAVLPPTIRTSPDHVHAVDDPAHTSRYGERVAHNEKDRPGPGMRLGGNCDLGPGRSALGNWLGMIREKILCEPPGWLMHLFSQISQEPLGERLGILPMHEMPARDLLDDVLVLEHPGGAPIVRRLRDRIIEAGKDHCRHRDSRPQ